MRWISVVLLLILFAFAGRVAAQSPTSLSATPAPHLSPVSTPTPQPPPMPVTPAPQGDQGTNWAGDVPAWLTFASAWVFAYLGWRRWRQDREAKALDQLYQKYQDSEFADALKKVGEFQWDEDSSNNRYVLAEAFLFDPEHEKERDEARRIVTTFWYRVAFLLDRGVITDEKTFVLFGPPDIVVKLEALEVVKADRLGRIFPVEWPPLALLDRYRRRKTKRHFPTLPLNQEEFDRWKKGNRLLR